MEVRGASWPGALLLHAGVGAASDARIASLAVSVASSVPLLDGGAPTSLHRCSTRYSALSIACSAPVSGTLGRDGDKGTGRD